MENGLVAEQSNGAHGTGLLIGWRKIFWTAATTSRRQDEALKVLFSTTKITEGSGEDH